jgi:hypothetical protein
VLSNSTSEEENFREKFEKRTDQKIRAQRTKPSKFRSREKSEEGKGLRFLTGAAFYCAELNLT